VIDETLFDAEEKMEKAVAVARDDLSSIRTGRANPGMFARVNVLLETRSNALWVPEQAIWPQGSDSFVYRVVEGKALLTKVDIGLRRPGSVEIAKGVSEGRPGPSKWNVGKDENIAWKVAIPGLGHAGPVVGGGLLGGGGRWRERCWRAGSHQAGASQGAQQPCQAARSTTGSGHG